MGTVLGPVDLDALGIINDLAELSVPPTKLDYGLYKATYTMEMTPSVGDGARYLSQSFTYLKVEKSPIVAMMMKGGVSAVKKSSGQTVFLDPASYSYDPDIDRTASQVLYTTCFLSVFNIVKIMFHILTPSFNIFWYIL